MKPLKIHRGNYEEFFLLYVDNELSATARNSVDAFIQEHPDLKIELEMMLDSKLPVEQISFEPKHVLIKNETARIEELQLLCIDNELSDAEKDRLKRFHEKNPEAIIEFDLLKRTKLPQEQITFPFKDQLYKRHTTITVMRWLIPATTAAAIIVLFLLKKPANDLQSTPSEFIFAENEVPVTKDLQPRITKQMDKKMGVKKETPDPLTVRIESTTSPFEETLKTEEKPAVNTEINIQWINPETEFIADPIMEEQRTEINNHSVPIKSDYVQEAAFRIDPPEEPYRSRKSFRGIIRKASRIYHKITNEEFDRPIIRFAKKEHELK